MAKPQKMAGAPKRGDQKMENGLKYRWNGKKWVRDHSWGGIKKKTTSNSKTNTPPPTKPKRSDYAAGSYGQSKFNVALAKYNRNNKTTTKTTKSVSKEVQKQIDSNEAAKNQYKNDPAGYFGTKLTIGDKQQDKQQNNNSSDQSNDNSNKNEGSTNNKTVKKKEGKSVDSDKPAEKLKVKPKKMHRLEKESRARFGDAAIDHLQAKHKDFKKMQSGEITKEQFIKKYPNSITARESNKGRRRK